MERNFVASVVLPLHDVGPSARERERDQSDAVNRRIMSTEAKPLTEADKITTLPVLVVSASSMMTVKTYHQRSFR